MDAPPRLDSRLLQSTDGTLIYAEAVGDRRNPAIVFAHGFTVSAGVFNRIFHDPKYSENFYLVRYDMRGHGRSGKPDREEGHESRLYADDFAVIAKSFKLQNIIFVGWSLGGIILTDIATHLPENTLAGVVYLGGLFSTTGITSFLTEYSNKCLSVLITPNVDASVLQSATIDFSKGIFAMSSEDPLRDELDRYDIQSAWLGYGANQTIAHRQCIIFRKQDTTNIFSMGKKGFPALIVHGTQDALVSADKVIAEARERFTNLEVRMIEKGGCHAVFHENPDDVMKYIGDFANRVKADSIQSL